jgi:hypothetical protein
MAGSVLLRPSAWTTGVSSWKTIAMQPTRYHAPGRHRPTVGPCRGDLVVALLAP